MRLWSVGSIIHMIRLTRLFNSPGSRLLNSIRGRRRLLPSANCAFLPLFANPNRSFPFSNHFSRIPSSSFPISPVMDPSAPATASVSEAAPNPNRYTDSGPPEGIDFALATGDSQCSTELGADRKRVVPEEIAKGVVYLECESSAEGGSCDVYLVGTAHVSQESCKEVQAVISYLKPQVVFLELCSSRVAILAPRNLEVPTVSEMIDMWKKKKVNTFGILYNWFLTKVASKLEVLPGSEFRVAYEEAQSYGAKVILGDRPVQITLRRTWGKMTLWHRAKFLYYILFQTIFLPNPEDLNKMLKEMDDVDMLTLVIQEMSKAFPTLMETLLHERDMYMSSHLLKVASNHSSVVAVVGKGHLSGIKKHWKQPVEVKHLLEVPFKDPRIFRMKTLAAAGIAVTGIVVASGLYFWGKK